MSQWISYRITQYGQPLEPQVAETPVPRGTEVLLRITGCGVCHSDLHTWEGFFDLGGGRRTQAGGKTLPLTPGHEIAGEVVAVGPEAVRVEVGDQRVVYPWIGCGEADCQECRRGDEQMCGKLALGVFQHGGFSDHVLVPHPRYLVNYGALPAALAATFACSGLTAYAALKKVGKLGPQDKLLIIGAGGVGMSAVRLAHTVTVQAPIVADIDPAKRAAALAAGAAQAFDPSDREARRAILAATGGVVAACDFVGSDKSLQFTTGVLARGGKVIVTGLLGGNFSIPAAMIAIKAMTIEGSITGTLAEARELIDLARTGKLTTIPTHDRPLKEAQPSLDALRAGHVVGRTVLAC